MHKYHRVPADKLKSEKEYYKELGMATEADKVVPVDLNDQIVFLDKENKSNFKMASEDAQRRVDNSNHA